MSGRADKIHALLAKAASSEFAAEREALTEAAERLMVKWGIDDAMVDSAGRSKDRRAVPIIQRSYVVEGIGAALLAETVGPAVARGLAPVRTLIARGNPIWWCIGYADDIARIELYVPSLMDQCRDAWRDQLRAWGPAWFWSGSERERARVAFFSAFGWRVEARLRQLFRDEVAAQTGDGSALVVVGRQEAVNDEVRRLHPHLKQTRDRRLDAEGALAGRAAGDAAAFAAGALS